MKTLALIGGTSWVSTIDYYRYINQGINDKLGGVNAARLVMHSFNYADIVKNTSVDDWAAIAQMITEAANNLKNAGAQAIVLCANTMHLVAGQVEQNVGLPIIHIADATAKAINARQLTKVGLLGTKFTMERDFFKDKLTAAGIETLIPDADDRAYIQRTLHEELGKGLILPQTKQYYLNVIDRLIARGAQGIILGCTEIPLLISAADHSIPMFDTTVIHSAAAVEFALGE